MNKLILPALLLTLALGSCSKSPVSSGGEPIYADQQYYPTLKGTFWTYRIDTTGSDGRTVRDVQRQTSRIIGSMEGDSGIYAVQVNEVSAGVDVTFDTLYIRKSGRGVHFTSPALRAGLLPNLPGIGSFPSELLLVPFPLEETYGTTWSILNFEFNQIPLFPIYIRVKAAFIGYETVTTDTRTFKNCARILVTIDARFPNLQNPQDLLNPTIIKENASFWLCRPLGLVMGDGSSLLFALLGGRLPFTLQRRRVHQELLNCDIVQPKDPCVERGGRY